MGEQRYKALLIGNARFERDPHNLPELKGPPEDLKLFERALTDPEIGLHAPGDVRCLLDATSTEVREAIDDFFNSATRTDQLLFYYSGHGRQDANNSLFLCARDTRTDRLASTAVGDVLINQMIDTSHAERTLIVLDCCHSGSFKGGGMPEALAQASGRFLLTSCRNQQLATDAPDTGGASAFTSYLVQALLSGEVDENQDGFVTLTEVYHYLLPKLKLATQQIPQLHLDKTVGDLPLARAPRAKRMESRVDDQVRPAPTGRPVLGVSDTRIDLPQVKLGERLPAVTIDVFNEGEGELDWKATTEDDWIEIEPGKTSFKLRVKPIAAGPHRGSIYVRDTGRGGSKRISVFAEVLEAEAKPKLSVAQSTLEFGRLKVGEKAPPHVIRISNRGGGELRAKVQSSNPAVRVSIEDTVITVDPDVSNACSLEGEITITSAGGRAVVKVTGLVELGPVLQIRPSKTVDFGTIQQTELGHGAGASKRLKVVNSGSGNLNYVCQVSGGDFFEVSCQGDRIDLALKADLKAGDYLGSLLVTSNGGDATLNVRAQVQAAPPPIPPPLPPPVPPAFPPLAGWWQTPNGRIFVSGVGPVYQYTDYNVFGAQVGGGTLQFNNGQIFMQGAALFVPYTGQLWLNGPMMTGMIACMGAQSPIVYSRC